MKKHNWTGALKVEITFDSAKEASEFNRQLQKEQNEAIMSRLVAVPYGLLSELRFILDLWDTQFRAIPHNTEDTTTARNKLSAILQNPEFVINDLSNVRRVNTKVRVIKGGHKGTVFTVKAIDIFPGGVIRVSDLGSLPWFSADEIEDVE
jgi:hypothetical protein